MNIDTGIWDKLSRIVVVLMVAATLLAVAIWYTPVIQHNERLRKDKLALDRSIEEELERARRLDSSLKALQDPRTMERLARERLSYARPGELVIHFEAPTNSFSR